MAPESEEEHIAFDELENIHVEGDHGMSATIGWAIKLGGLLLTKADVRDMKTMLRGSMEGRSTQNWAYLFICAKQVRIRGTITLIFMAISITVACG